MNSPLEEQQTALQQHMLRQRAQLARLLQPGAPMRNDYPRSLTMRFFHERPGLATQLLTQGVTLLLGGRLLKALGSALLLGRAVRSLAIRRDL